MNQPVMMPAQQHKIVDTRKAPVSPVDEVMSIAPVRGSVATGEHTPTVPSVECPTHRRRNLSHRTADIQGLTARPKHHPGHRAITTDPPDGIGR